MDNPRIHRNEIRFRSDNVHREPLIFFLKIEEGRREAAFFLLAQIFRNDESRFRCRRGPYCLRYWI